MSRFADRYRVVFVEEPELAADASPSMLRKREIDGVTVLTPLLTAREFEHGYGEQSNAAIRALLSDWLKHNEPGPRPVVWYWTPLALGACPGIAVDRAGRVRCNGRAFRVPLCPGGSWCARKRR